MARLTRRVKNFKTAGELTRSSFLKEREYEVVNVEALRGIISYLKYLYAEGEINDSAYKALVSQVLSTFVENSIHFKVERMFDEVDEALEEANEVLLSNILI